MGEFETLVVQRMNGNTPDVSNIDPSRFLAFAAKEAYLHIRGRAPDVPEDDELSKHGRCAAFVCAALLSALECAGWEMSEWMRV